jgi:hypothetical protein
VRNHSLDDEVDEVEERGGSLGIVLQVMEAGMNYEEKSDALRRILREDAVLGRGATSTKDGKLSPQQRRRAEPFLDEGPGREQRCRNNGTQREGREATRS